jgi:Restriction endonuclease AspBHI N-terminal
VVTVRDFLHNPSSREGAPGLVRAAGQMPWTRTREHSPTSGTTGHQAGTCTTRPRKKSLLSRAFERAHAGQASREQVPPFLLFDKPGTGRDVRFRGLLAPGSDRISGEEDLVAVWRTTGRQRFQNYRARFTVLDVGAVSRAWISQVAAGEPLGPQCPDAWHAWVETGTYTPLLAPPTVIIRTREQQRPAPADKPLLDLVYGHFKDRPHALSSSPRT